MTRFTPTLHAVVALAALLAAPVAHAEPGSDAIMLERIGAVRMASPAEVRQQNTPDRHDHGHGEQPDNG